MDRLLAQQIAAWRNKTRERDLAILDTISLMARGLPCVLDFGELSDEWGVARAQVWTRLSKVNGLNIISLSLVSGEWIASLSGQVGPTSLSEERCKDRMQSNINKDRERSLSLILSETRLST
jgi:hypothetical protein